MQAFIRSYRMRLRNITIFIQLSRIFRVLPSTLLIWFFYCFFCGLTTNFTGTRLLQFTPNSTLLVLDAQCDESMCEVPLILLAT